MSLLNTNKLYSACFRNIPHGWNELRLKYVANAVVEKPKKRNLLAPYVGLEHVGSGIGRLLQFDESFEDSSAILCRKGDVLFGKLRPYLAKCFLAEREFRCSSEFLVLRSSRYNPNYLRYLLLTKEFIELVNASTYGAKMPRASWDFIGNIIVPLPPMNVQEEIANYLDQQTAKLDQLIEKKQRLIHLLQEKRQALITQAVTKGLDPNVPMKDSGIKWLGEVPAHWRIEKLKYHVYLNPETLSENTDPEQELLYIEIGNVSSYGEISDATYYLFKNAPSRARRKVRSGDVIISTVRTYLKAITYIKDAPENLVVSTGFAVLRAKDQLLNSFLGKYVRNEGFINEIVARSVGVSYPAINASELIELWVVIPPIEEQRAIVDWLNSRLSNIDKIITNIEKQIATIQEYRQALITAAVTGQIDVLREKLAVSADPIPAGKE